MSDRMLRQFRQRAESLVAVPDLNELQQRGIRRKRARFAAAAAVLALVVGGVFGIRALDAANRPVEPIVRGDSWIVYRSGSELIAVDPDHPTDAASVGPSHRLDPIASSQDGSRLLLGFGGATEDLYVLNVDGSRIRLTDNGASYSGSFSPDGERVVYATVISRNGHFLGGLYVIDSAGGTPRLLIPARDQTNFADPAWSPDGSRIAFIEWTIVDETSWGEPIYRKTLWAMNPDGTQRQVLRDLGREDRSPTGSAMDLAWSPDGSQIAFTGGRTRPQIYVVNADGSGLRRLTDKGWNYPPVWSPDGSRIAFTCTFDGSAHLCTMTADGTDVREINLGDSPTGGDRFVWTSSLDPLT